MNIDFENIRREFTEFTKELNASYQGKLISFSFELENSNSMSFADRINQYFDDIFIFGSPSTENILIGINSTVELLDSNSKKFTEATSNCSFFKKNIITNSDATAAHFNPIIFCSAKFDPSKNHSLWIDYSSLRLYIPEIIFSFRNEKTYVHYNFLAGDKTRSNDKLAKLENYLNFIFRTSSRLENAPEDYISVSSKENNVEIKYWNEAVTKALDKLKNKQLEKIVLSRVYSFVPKSEINWEKLLSKLHERFPDCYLFFIKKNESIFFGSSPEMFLKVRNSTAEVESVAGSAPRGERSESDYELEKYLKSSNKNHREHLFVSDFISDILIKYSNDVRIIEEKQIRKLDNIQHLITKISAELNSKENIFELIDSLFPTPAVCGVPKDTAMELIRTLENHDRGLYSGLAGVFDFEGNCELAVTIRSALFKGNRVTAFAGAGLLKNSDPEEELLETNLKLNTILSMFENENKN